MTSAPRITFGVIVLNGEPFIAYTLRSLYPFAHEIIVVEGAAPAARHIATADGHSLDSTLDTIQRFQAQEDPENKVTLITRAGFWSEKDAMSRAYAERATGDYLWQVDADEFYQPADMRALCDLLSAQPHITAISFQTLTFWGAPDYIVDGWNHRRGAGEYHRLFKWSAGYRYATHRPPTVLDETGRDLRQRHWLRAADLKARGIYLYHYSLLLPKQVLEKSAYYSRADWARRPDALHWAHDAYLALNRPFHTHNVAEYPACLYRFRGPHPPQIERMWRAITSPDSPYETRPTADIEALLRSRRYQLARWLVMRANEPSRRLRQTRLRLQALIARCLPRALKDRLKRLL